MFLFRRTELEPESLIDVLENEFQIHDTENVSRVKVDFIADTSPSLSETPMQNVLSYTKWIPKWKYFRPPTWRIFRWAYKRKTTHFLNVLPVKIHVGEEAGKAASVVNFEARPYHSTVIDTLVEDMMDAHHNRSVGNSSVE